MASEGDELHPQRRRMTDGQPKRRREDYFHERLSDVEDQVEALRLLPERVAGLRDAVEQLRITMRDMAQVEDQRITDVRADLREVQATVMKVSRENGVEHERTREVAATAPILTWAAVAKFATIVATLLVPILAAYVAAKGGP
jgi:predicted RNA-binding Zn ribbon-like protein